ncbi:unnamed protein product [Closterium sp. NIES-65]|nr:unnamed protein product [Closterium sp. NIES-65]
MYAVSISNEGDCYPVFPPDPGIETAALGTGEAAALGASEAAALGASASASSGAGESALAVAVSLADPSGGLVLSHFSTVLPCPAAPSGTLSGLYLPSFSTNLVSGADLQDAGVHQFTLARQRVTHCSEARKGRHLATVYRVGRGRGLYTPTTESPPVPASGQVAASGQVFAAASRSGPESAPCSCRLLSHETLLWHQRLGHPSLPRPGPTCVPCVEGRLRAAPCSSQFPPTEAPLQTLHINVRGPARVRGQGHERYFLLVVDDYSRYTTVGDASAFRVWGSRAFVRNLSADKLSPRAAPWVFLGSPLDAPGWLFYHPTSRRVLSSQDVTFDESVPYYRLFPYRTPSLPHHRSSLCQVDAVEPVEVTGDSGAVEGAKPGGAHSGGAERVGATPKGAEREGATTGGAESGGAEPGGTTPGGAEPGGAEPGGATRGGTEPGGAEPEGARPAGAVPGGSPVRWRRAAGPRGAAGTGGSVAAEGACATGLGGARTGSTGAAGLRVLLELELLRVLARRLLLSVLEAVLLGVLLVLLEVLELELLLVLVLPLGVLVLSLLCLESPRGLGRTSFRSFSRFLVSRLLLVLLLP